MIRWRRFHNAPVRWKNPYYFYDLAKRQPRSSFDPHRPYFSEGLGHAVAVFGEMGSRALARQEAQSKTQVIAGVKVPPKPEEPTNCCMSGCINCVWEGYKDELGEWRALRNEAKQRLVSPEYLDTAWPEDYLGPEPDRKKEGTIKLDDDAWSDVDMSIRVFVETEKKIRERRASRGM